MKAELHRIDKEKGTWGVWIFDGEVFCRTIERPWIDNIINVSCIPTGKYTCKRIKSGGFGVTFEVMDVEGRTLIRIHWGSYIEDYKGCIGVGQRVMEIGSRKMLRNTKTTFEKFMKHLEGVDTFELTIT